jgi:DNA-binding response OmpR family regulator
VPRQQIGEWLVERGLASADDVQRSLAEAHAKGTRLASQLLALGAASEAAIVEALATHLGVPGIDLSQSAIRLEPLSLIPQEVAEVEHILPVQVAGDKLVLAMADAHNGRVVQEVELISGLSVLPHVALASRLEDVIAWAYAAAARGESLWVGEGLPRTQDTEILAIVRPGEIGAVPLEDLARLDSIPPRDFDFDIHSSIPGSSSSEEEIGMVRARTSPPVIFVVDDEEDILNLVTKTLEKSGYTVEVARRGNEAVAKANAVLPDLVLLDAHLPELHGFDVCRKLKSNPRFARIPIVMMTAVYRGWRFAQDSRESFGADDYIEKPFSLADLLRRVEYHLTRADGEPITNRAEAEKRCEDGMKELDGGRPREAVTTLEQAIEIDPFNPKIHYQLGRALQATGESYRAISAYERSADLRPDHFPALRALAALYQQKGFRRKALEAWERAIPAAPDEATRQKIKNSLMLML